MEREIRILKISRLDSGRMARLCDLPDPTLERDTIVFDCKVPFDNERIAYVQVISSKDPAKEPCWTQAVLLQQSAANAHLELACTAPGNAFLGEYRLHSNHKDYVIDVILDNHEED